MAGLKKVADPESRTVGGGIGVGAAALLLDSFSSGMCRSWFQRLSRRKTPWRATLAQRLAPMELRDLIRQFAGVGCNEPDRAKLRQEFKLTEKEIPSRPYVGWGSADAT